MNKSIKKIISAAMIGVSLCTVGTFTMPTASVSASIEEDGLKNQCIYREGDYVIAKENASHLALIQTVWMEFMNYQTLEGIIGYDAPNYVGTKTFLDGTVVTVEKSFEEYTITYKIKQSVFKNIDEERVTFETESFGGNNYPHYIDNNGGQRYRL